MVWGWAAGIAMAEGNACGFWARVASPGVKGGVLQFRKLHLFEQLAMLAVSTHGTGAFRWLPAELRDEDELPVQRRTRWDGC